MTFDELDRKSQSLEAASAMVLGRILFAFSRLDARLGHFLVWTSGGQEISKLTEVVSDLTFHKKIEYLRKLAQQPAFAPPSLIEQINAWLDQADIIRRKRNDFIHGRWDVSPETSEVINVIGLTTDPNLAQIPYTVAALSAVLREIQELHERINAIHMAHHRAAA